MFTVCTVRDALNLKLRNQKIGPIQVKSFKVLVRVRLKAAALEIRTGAPASGTAPLHET